MTSDVECCWIVGSFGNKSQYYELSMDVGGDLQAQFADEPERRPAASGTSCTEQMSDLFARKVTHPIEFIAPDI